jgi:hypothetical protein
LLVGSILIYQSLAHSFAYTVLSFGCIFMISNLVSRADSFSIVCDIDELEERHVESIFGYMPSSLERF